MSKSCKTGLIFSLLATIVASLFAPVSAYGAACPTTSQLDFQVMRAFNQNPCGGPYLEPAFRIDNHGATPVNINTLAVKMWTNNAPTGSFWGFDAGPDAVNGERELFGLRFLFSTVPSLFFLSGALIVWKYPITEQRHAEIRAELAARDSQLAADT